MRRQVNVGCEFSIAGILPDTLTCYWIHPDSDQFHLLFVYQDIRDKSFFM